MTELGRLAVLILCVAVVLYVAGHFIVTYWQPKDDRFVHTGGSEDPYVMFDKKTAQACYAGSPEALKDRMETIRQHAGTDDYLGSPPALTANYFPENKAGFAPPLFIEITRQVLEYKKMAAEEFREADKLSELAKLPTCRSLL